MLSLFSREDFNIFQSLDFPAVTICNLNMLRISEVNKRAFIKRIFQEVNRRQLGDGMKTENLTKSNFQKNLSILRDVKKTLFLSKARTPEQRKTLRNVGLDTISLQSSLLHMMLKNIPEDNLTSLGHDLDEMLKHCRWSYYTCHRG